MKIKETTELTDPKPLPTDQLKQIVTILNSLPREEQERIIKTVVVFYSIRLGDPETW